MSHRIIEVVEHDPEWASRFEQEKQLLQAAIGDCALKIEHIGSTAVRGLAAKPVIDILIEVANLEELDRHQGAIGSLGYVARGENGIEGRRYFQKGGEQRSHHLHAFRRGDAHLMRHRAFRDYLMAHPDVAQAYGTIKRVAAIECKNDMTAYMQHKNRFIQYHQQQAIACYDPMAGADL
ncbi:GrpB family protein [Shewanella sp. AS16]|uniref:GrpB family protein n=1 Tax=Shewanella sp. AS16 TaxID=2907625 RepID=UPI001F482519|nr:GrpB family protein [Shewanella sp. AS16]MCE9687632.1 GrpB family protein [Shewanella sp. AS16]